MNRYLKTSCIALLAIGTLLLQGCGGGGSAGANPESGATTYSVGGTVSNLSGTGLVLQNNGAGDLAVNASGAFQFSTTFANGATYNVTVKTQPSAQTCTVSNGSGSVSGANVSNVAVNCVAATAATYTVGGTVSGLNGTLVLQNNSGDNLSLGTNGSFTFTTPIASGGAYAVAVQTQPSGQSCNVSSGSGTATADVTTVSVACADTSVAGAGWAKWAGNANGLVPGNLIKLAVASNHDIFYTFLVPNTTSSGKVWKGNTQDPTHTFTLMPQTGFTLPANHGSNNVNTLTVNQQNEPVVGLFMAQQNTVNPPALIYRFDTASQTWVAATLNNGTWPTLGIYAMRSGPDGTIWATAKWQGYVYRSTDGGHTFDTLDLNALIAASHPDFFPTYGGFTSIGCTYGLEVTSDNTVLVGPETVGALYSSDGGQTWHPVDADYTNPNSAMAAVGNANNTGNTAGVGYTADGKWIINTTPIDGYSIKVVDPAAHTVTSGTGYAPWYLAGLSVGRFLAMPGGEILFHSAKPSIDLTTGASLSTGGLYVSSDNGLTWAQDNNGINETNYVPAISQWNDSNGAGASGSLAKEGSTAFTATTQGNIYFRIYP